MSMGPAHFLALLENTRRIGTWRVDVRAGTAYWSEVTYAIHEEDPSKPIPVEKGIDYYVPEHRPTIRRCVERAIEEGCSWDVELQILTARGNVLWVRAIGAALAQDGVVSHLYGVFEDIDERKRMEAEREEMLTLQLEGERVAKLGHWKRTLSTNHLEWTPGSYRIFGLDETEGPPSDEKCWELVHPEDRELFQRAMAGAAENSDASTTEFRIVVAGCIRYLRLRSVPSFDAMGKLRYLLGTVNDISENIAADQRNDELRVRLSFALEAAEIGAWDWDLTTDELIWDQQMYKLYGTEQAQFDGAYAAWERGLHPDDKESAVAAINEAIENQGRFDTQFRVVWPSGTVRVIRAIARVQTDSTGKPARMIGVNWDITELERNERELENSNRELAHLAYRASHDLKAPLTTIKRLANYVAEDIEEGRLVEAGNDLAVIVRQAASLEELVLGILENARGDVVGVAPQEVDLDSLVEEVSESLASLSADQGVVVTRDVSTSRSYLFPRVRLYQIVTNLVSNAIRYSDPTREKRYVRISISEQASRVRLVVKDNGLGIPPGAEASIYEMFRTFHSPEVAGSGLGMYVVNKHVEAMAGSIKFESSPEGTTFEIELPAGGPT